MTNDDIQKEIRARLTELTLSADEVLKRLADQARGSMAHFITIREDGSWVIDFQKAAAAGVLHLVKGIEKKKDGFKLELYSAQEALALLGKHHRLFVERMEHSGPDGGPISTVPDLTGLSDEDLLQLLANLERAGGTASANPLGADAPEGTAGAGAGPAIVDDPTPADAGPGSAV